MKRLNKQHLILCVFSGSSLCKLWRLLGLVQRAVSLVGMIVCGLSGSFWAT